MDSYLKHLDKKLDNAENDKLELELYIKEYNIKKSGFIAWIKRLFKDERYQNVRHIFMIGDAEKEIKSIQKDIKNTMELKKVILLSDEKTIIIESNELIRYSVFIEEDDDEPNYAGKTISSS